MSKLTPSAPVGIQSHFDRGWLANGFTLGIACLLVAIFSNPSPAARQDDERKAKQETVKPNETAKSDDADAGEDDEKKKTTSADKPEPPEIDEEKLVRLHQEHRVWFDPTNKLVLVDGEVCLREGQLEVFACPRGTKEHESVVRVSSPAFYVHVGLVRVGAIPGKPVSFDPEYRAAEGMIIDVWAYWKNKEGKLQKTRAQEWVRHADNKKQLNQEWVFGGSGFWVDEESGEKFYQAEGGELICLSNFSTATMDLPIESSQSNASLLFEPFTERIPARGTPVRLVLKPRIPKKEETEKAKGGEDKTADQVDTKSDEKKSDDDDKR